MKKMMLLLPLLFSVNAFAFENPCADGNCTMQQIEAYNRANYKTSEQMIQEADAWEAEHYKWWVEYHREAQARADALPKYQYKPGGQKDNCVTRFYEEASGIIGDYAKNYISVREIDGGKCEFDIKFMAEEMCEYFDSFASLATPHWSTAEWCRYRLESVAVTDRYRDIIYTPAFTDDVKQRLKAELKPIEDKHEKIIQRLFEIEEKRLNQ
ncbi:hypothetical protein [Pseudomonas qingdaonensis]|uniref:hypothetical protein n=1 Tax=Pseudomonas qingdaonensis TaxID=2056231 RepID=UPI0012FD4FA7|nr:hypothetical protein [Pseudomonas qingdaonensis]